MENFQEIKEEIVLGFLEMDEISESERVEFIELIENSDIPDLISLIRTGYTQEEFHLNEGIKDKISKAKDAAADFALKHGEKIPGFKGDVKGAKAAKSFMKGAGRTAGERKIGTEKYKKHMKNIKGKAGKAAVIGAGAAALTLGGGAYLAHRIRKKRKQKEIERWNKFNKKSKGKSKNESLKLDLRRKIFSELIGTRYVPLKARGDTEFGGDEEDEVDFPYVEDPEPYVTHRPMEGYYSEQGEEMAAAPPGAEGMPPEGEVPPEGMMPPGMEQPEPLSADQIGRVYELKKIYSRMTSIESYLAGSSDVSLIEVRKNVSKAIDLFEVVITNFPQFEEKVDNIIVTFYKFLEQVFNMVKEHYQEASRNDK